MGLLYHTNLSIYLSLRSSMLLLAAQARLPLSPQVSSVIARARPATCRARPVGRVSAAIGDLVVAVCQVPIRGRQGLDN